jgi:23S rRNA-/tRNA-specific pseudouridylate synthase
MVPRKSANDLDLSSRKDFDTIHSDYVSNVISNPSSIVLYKSKNFLIINKPPFIRMNGDFDITVEKIVTLILPYIPVSNLKWVHQLDFATSGYS